MFLGDHVFDNVNDFFPVLLRKQPDNVPREDMFNLCLITGKHIIRIYVLIR